MKDGGQSRRAIRALRQRKADRCVGSVVNGQCIGTVMPDYGNAWQNQRPADTFLDNQRGIHTLPPPDVGFEGNQFYNRMQPMPRGGQLRWADPNELEK